MAVDGGLILPMDFDTAKAEAKIRKLNREMEISQQKAENIKKSINGLNEELASEERLQKDIKDKISEQSKEAAKLEQQISKVKNGTATIGETMELGGLDFAEQKLSEMEKAIQKNYIELEKSDAKHKKISKEIAKQNIALNTQNSKTADIGDQILLNGKKQNKFTQTFEKSQKSADRFAKRIKSLIASALFFSVITKAFTALRNEFGKLITETGTKTASLVAQLKSNLATIGRTLYEGARPYIEWLLEKLAMITQLLSEAVAKALGKDINQMRKLANSTDKVAENAERTEKATAGFDTLQKIDTPSTSDSSQSSPATATDAMTFTDEELAKTKEKLDEILDLVGKIALGFLAWKISKSFLGNLGGAAAAFGVVGLLDSIKDIMENGLNLGNTLEATAAGALIGAAIGYKLGGAIGGLIGALIGAGGGLLIAGITSMAKEGIQGKNLAAVIGGVLIIILGIVLAVKKFNKAKSPIGEFDAATDTVSNVDTGTSKLTGKLKNLVKNLALGIVIIAEVAIAAGLFVAAIWGIGVLLEQVGIAWQPVIDNAGTIAIAVGIGTVLLAAIGVAVGLMGSLGGASLIVALALGIAILAELSVATDLFLAEILVIGLLLQKIGEAWQPVLDNGDTIKSGIAIGTTLLIGIGVVTAALGAATVASAGLLPLAIGLGTAILVELAAALVLFIESLVEVADHMTYELYPALKRLNSVLPELSSDMEDYTGFMKKFAGHVVSYTKSSAISGISSTVDSIVKFFTKDPIKSLSNDAEKQYKQATDLNKNLKLANPELNKSISLMQKYYELLTQLSKLTDKINNVSISKNIFKNFKSIIGSLGGSISSFFSSTSPAVAINTTHSTVPALATGAVLPGGSPMLAWVNDQPKGQPYLEGSIDNIAAAFEKYLGNKGFGNQNITIEANGNWAQFIKWMNLEIKKESKRASIWG